MKMASFERNYSARLLVFELLGKAIAFRTFE
jgi:hypothetical protein